MKFKSYLWMVLAIIGILVFGSNLHADPVVHIDDPYGGRFNGGPFLIREMNLETFCLERGETFVPGAAYYFTINSYAQGGGPGSINNMDPIDPRTAWLYLQYLSNPGSYDLNHKIALQLAIWRIEDEFGVGFLNGYNGYEYLDPTILGYATEYFIAANAATRDPNILNNVFALNLYGNTAHTNWRQSQLTVPEPSTLLLLGAGLIGLGILGRRKYRGV